MPEPPKLDLNLVNEITVPKAPAKEMPPITKAGVELAKWVLVIISIFIAFAIIVLVISENKSLGLIESSYSQLMKSGASVETANSMKDIVTQLETQRIAFRDFWLKFIQIVLLNLLLPVLTAILGYVFGSKEGNR